MKNRQKQEFADRAPQSPPGTPATPPPPGAPPYYGLLFPPAGPTQAEPKQNQIDLTRVVHFSSHGRNPFPSHRIVAALPVPIAIAASLTTLALAFAFTAGPVLILSTLLLSYVGGMALWTWLRIRGFPPGPEWVDRAMAFQPNDQHRLRVIAGPREAFALTNLDDTPFEPRVFTITFALPPSRSAEWTIYFAVCALWFGLYVGIGAGPPGTGHEVIRAALVVGLFAAVALGCPTYLRLSPGRLDVMRFLILSKQPRTTTFDLIAARILIDFNLDVISIEPPGAPDAAQIEMHSVLNRVELARAILEAARARAPGPPLPDDALTG